MEANRIDRFSELEYKYRADAVGLKDFLALMEELGYEKQLTVSSWDYYYTKADSDDFMRFRSGDATPELTIKRKVKETNNWVRVEVDLPLDPNRLDLGIVNRFVALERYSKNFRIYKSCFIFWQNEVNYVYYIVYDEQMREKGRFIEVEINKSKINPDGKIRLTKTECVDPSEVIKNAEKSLEKLGITYNNRLKKSLFEMFKS